MTRKKRGENEEPVMFDMDADEALERLVQTDPAEADALATDADAGQFADEPKHDTGDRLLPYVGKNGVEVSLRIEGDTFWATQGQMAEMFGVAHRSSISRHIKKIVAEGELPLENNLHLMQLATSKKPVRLYSLNMMISVAYRVESKQGTMFRIWATDKLVQYLTKGFAIDAPRLKEPGEFATTWRRWMTTTSPMKSTATPAQIAKDAQRRELAAIRKKAWITRRKRYGPNGNGKYVR